MKLQKYFQIIFFITLVANEVYFILDKSFPYAIGVLALILLFLIIIEAFERGLSNIMLKTPQTQLDITMVEKEIVTTSKKLATKLSSPKKQVAVEATTEILQENLQDVFQKGLRIAGYSSTHEVKKK